MKLARTTLVVIALASAAWFGVDELADATQTRPEHADESTATELTFSVELQHYKQGSEIAAATLWGTCAATVTGRPVAPGIVADGDGMFRVLVSPGLGKHARKRLIGCLNDLTIDRARAQVLRVHDVDLVADS